MRLHLHPARMIGPFRREVSWSQRQRTALLEPVLLMRVVSLVACLGCNACVLPSVSSFGENEGTRRESTEQSSTDAMGESAPGATDANGNASDRRSAPNRRDSGADPLAGSTSDAGPSEDSTDAQSDEMVAGTQAVAKAGTSCTEAGSIVCAAPATVDRLACVNDIWVPTDKCSNKMHCNSTSVVHAGSCQQIVEACEAASADKSVCVGDEVHVCGVDLLASVRREKCEAPRPMCRDGACTCASPCGAACADLNTDANHCGRCDHQCEGTKCVNGLCNATVIDVGDSKVRQVAVDDAALYYLEGEYARPNVPSGTVRVLRLAHASGAQPVLLLTHTEEDSLFQFALDGQSLFLATSNWRQETGGIVRVPIAGGPTTSLAERVSVDWLVARDGYVYYSLFSPAGVVRQAQVGGPPTKLLDTMIGGPGVSQVLAVNGEHAYYLDSNYNSEKHVVGRVPIGGGAEEQLFVANVDNPLELLFDAIAIDAKAVYWTEMFAEYKKKHLKRMPLSGGQASVIVADDAEHTLHSRAFLVDGQHVYFWQGALARVPCEGGAVEFLGNVDAPQSMAADSSYLYMATVNGALMRLPK